MNIYNTSVHAILKGLRNLEDRGAFFKADQIKIAGEILSFDIIEHGIMQKIKSKLESRLFWKIFVSRYERQMRIRESGPRIHYALELWRRKLPPIVAYHADEVNEELDASTNVIKTTTVKVTDKNIMVPVHVSSV